MIFTSIRDNHTFSKNSFNHHYPRTSQDTIQERFWQTLSSLCGKSYAGHITSAPPNDTTFTGQPLTMHICKCEKDKIYIPFIVGKDSSRTWIFSKLENRIELKHDHRHRDGSPDHLTMYGGMTTNMGNLGIQFFPADPLTRLLIPAAAGNVWWIEIIPNQYFSYNLRRVNTDRLFSINFDLSKTIVNPAPTWGWK